MGTSDPAGSKSDFKSEIDSLKSKKQTEKVSQKQDAATFGEAI